MRATLISWLDTLYSWLHAAAADVPGEPQFRYWQDGRLWFYGLVAGNNDPLVTSTQGYANKAAVLRAIGQCKRNAVTAEPVFVDRAVTE